MTAPARSFDRAGRTRIAVTGLGVKTPAGNDVETFWRRLLEGRSTAAAVPVLTDAGVAVTFGCRVPEFDVDPYVGSREARRLDRVTVLGLAAGLDAVTGAGLSEPEAGGPDPARCAVVAGTGVGGLETLESQERAFLERGPDRVSPFFVPMMMPNATAGNLSMRLGWTGPSLCIATACAAGANAIGEAARLIRSGAADIVLAGGTEAALTPLTAAAFWRMGALSTRNDDPASASRPFDADRDGFVLGEGAGFVVLERWDHAEARGVAIRGELAGYAATADAHHITAPAPGGAGAAACMQAALDDAGLAPGEIGHVNAHGTSTPLNDAAEAEAIGKVFGGLTPPVTAQKGVTGHLVGAAGAVEAVAALLSLEHGLLPPTANHERTDPEIGLDVVARDARALAPAPVVSNSFGFGGHNATLVLAPIP
jgi:3-oxoacyl-[acyl-carrier-protein] synthase II